MQNQEHTCFFRFQSELHESLSPLQFAKALALKQMNAVSVWSMIQLLATQTATPDSSANGKLPPQSNGVEAVTQNASLASQPYYGAAQNGELSPWNGAPDSSANSSGASLFQA